MTDTAMKILSLLAERGPMKQSDLWTHFNDALFAARWLRMLHEEGCVLRSGLALPEWSITAAGRERLKRERA